MPRYVLDTSALLTFFKAEPGSDLVLAILTEDEPGTVVHEVTRPPQVHIPFLALMEFEYQGRRRFGLSATERALRAIHAWPVAIVESDAEWRREAARVKAGGGLSLADAWMAALALLLNAELVHKDPEYDAVEGLRHLRLPYR